MSPSWLADSFPFFNLVLYCFLFPEVLANVSGILTKSGTGNKIRQDSSHALPLSPLVVKKPTIPIRPLPLDL
ncbi:hypothetical protein JB92DRAFT_2877917 [Gautieria morchelliformis]|nr:hypothetical protein JB92DRAFT_2877917 [Gautieria morchelliformis]